MLLPAGSFSEVHLHPFYYYIKNLISAQQHFIPRQSGEDRAFFSLTRCAPPSKCVHVTRNEFQAQEIHQKQ